MKLLLDEKLLTERGFNEASAEIKQQTLVIHPVTLTINIPFSYELLDLIYCNVLFSSTQAGVNQMHHLQIHNHTYTVIMLFYAGAPALYRLELWH